MHHFAGAKGETVIQIHGEGPFVVNYITPTDDPSRKSSPKWAPLALSYPSRSSGTDEPGSKISPIMPGCSMQPG
jgi:hypothetical protein